MTISRAKIDWLYAIDGSAAKNLSFPGYFLESAGALSARGGKPPAAKGSLARVASRTRGLCRHPDRTLERAIVAPSEHLDFGRRYFAIPERCTKLNTSIL
jgi:hypothetical protein